MRKLVRDRIIKRDVGRCVNCGSTENLQIDHIQPLTMGGRHDEENMQVLCRACNLKKSNKYDFTKYFSFGESPEYFGMSPDFGDVIKNISVEHAGRILKWAFSEHARIWKERGVIVSDRW